MTTSKSRRSYVQIKEILDEVLIRPVGTVVELDLKHKSTRDDFVFQVWGFIRVDRQDNCHLFPDPTHPMNNASEYDRIKMRKIGETKVSLEMRRVEAISKRVIEPGTEEALAYDVERLLDKMETSRKGGNNQKKQ